MIIIHGDNSLDSYNRLIQLETETKLLGRELQTYLADEVDINTIRQVLTSDNLFGETKTVVIKGLLSSSKVKNKEKIIDTILASMSESVILYETKSLSATALKPFSKSKVELFKVDSQIFKFLDLLTPGNSRTIQSTFRSLISKGVEVEYIFSMITRQFRLLIQAKSNPKLLKLAAYPSKLVISQSTSFSLDQLLILYESLYKIDKQIKTGQSSVPLELLLTSFLQKI